MSRRLDRVNELLRREISSVIQREYEFRNALVTVTQVHVTQDLKEARIWISVIGKINHASVLQKLNQAHGMIQSRVMNRVVLKSTPKFMFRLDDSAERGVSMINFLDEIERTVEPARDSDEAEQPEKE